MSIIKVVFSLFFLASIHGFDNNVNNGKLLLTVYYEGKCSDSASFIINQLVPTMQRLKDYVSLKFVPFGKAHSIQGGQSFHCQHGPSECLSNMIMDCSLHQMMYASDKIKLDYVACEMKTYAASQGNYQCIYHNPAVQACARSYQGVTLQRNSEYLTNLLRPKFIPALTLNGVFDPNIQTPAMSNLFSVLCTRLGNVLPCIGSKP